MKTHYIDYPEKYSDNTITSLSNEYAKKRVTPNSFFAYLQQGEKNMDSKILQTETDPQQQPNQPNNFLTENFRLFSLISSNYCNLMNLLANLIAKTSSSKREIYQTILAQLRVDATIFNNTFNTLCNIECGSFCNYNSLVYVVIESFIDLTQNLSNLSQTLVSESTESTTTLRLQSSAFDLFRNFINTRPIRY